MERKEFFEEVRRNIQNWQGKDAEVILQESLKLNGLAKTGLTIRQKDCESSASPILYLDDYYDEMEKAETGFDKTLAKIKKDLKAFQNAEISTEEIGVITNWQLAKDHVYPALISADRNQELLKEIVSTDFLDLKIIYLLRLDSESLGEAYGTVKITKQLLKTYGVSQEELHRQAIKNLKSDGVSFTAMHDVMAQLLGETEGGTPKPVEHFEPGELYCLTNSGKHYGASGMLDLELIRKTADGQSCYILPSSIHEVLLLSAEDSLDPKELESMVQSINASEVSPEEVLSDHVYYFDVDKGEILSLAS